MGQIIKSLVSVCLSPLPWSQFALSFDEICTVVWNPKSKMEFIAGQNPTITSPVFPNYSPCNALSVARSKHHSFEPCAQIVAFDSSKDARFSAAAILAVYWR